MLFRFAQEIVDTVSKIIGYDVLITDREGIIIACSNPLRGKGSFHEGTLRVVKENRWYIDTHEDVQNLKGTGEGITCPISDPSGRVMGVIAVTGNPEKVKTFGLVVQHFANLMFRERMLWEHAQEEGQNRLNLLRAMIYFDPKSDKGSELSQMASRFGFSETNIYKVFLVDAKKVDNNTKGLFDNQKRQLFYSKFEKWFFSEISWKPVFFSNLEDLISVYILEVPNGQNILAGELEKTLNKGIDCQETYKQLKIGIGSAVTGVIGISKSFQEAKKAVKIAKALGNKGVFFDIENLKVEEMLLSIHMELADPYVSKRLNSLKKLPDYPILRETLMAWFKNDFSSIKTSEELHLHRNSLRYRIQKMEALLGMDLKSFSKTHSLYLALALESLMELR